MRKLLLLACCYLAFSYAASGQKADSIRNLLAEYKYSDTARVNLLIELAVNYCDLQPDSSIAVCKRSLALSRAVGYKQGMAKSYYQLATSYTMVGNADSAFPNYRTAIRLFQLIGNKEFEARARYDLGVSFYRNTQYDSAEFHISCSAEIGGSLGDYDRQTRAIFGLGDIYRDKGMYARSAEYYLKALAISEKHNFNHGIGEAYRDLADIYSLTGDNKKALDYINKAQAIYKTSDDIQEQLVNYSSIATVYGQMKDFTHALEVYRKAWVLADSMGNPYWKGANLLNMGECHFSLAAYDSAAYYYSTALQQGKLAGDPLAQAFSQRGLGNVHIKQGRYKAAIPLLLPAYKVIMGTGMKKEVSDLAGSLAEAYEKLGDYRNAFHYSQVFHQFRDSVFNNENARRLQQMQYDYELNKKQSQIELLKREQLLRQATLDKQHFKQWAMLIAIACLAVTVYILVVGRRKDKKNKQQITQQRDEITAQASSLKELNTFKDKTFSVLSHDLKGPVASLSGIMSYLESDELSQEEFGELKPEVNRQLASLSMLLDNLLNWSKSHIQGAASLNIQPTDIHKLTTGNADIVRNAATYKGITLVNNVPAGINALCDEGQINVVIRNLLNNAIKFTPSGKTVKMNALQTGNTVAITITDTGVGMTQAQLDGLFKPNPGSTFGTNGEKGVGLGLLLCHEFVTANNGTLTASSVLQQGTTFTITLPAAGV